MKATRWIAALVLIASGNAWSHETSGEGKPHSHWWLDGAWYAGAGAALVAYSDWSAFGDGLDDGSYTSRSEDDQASGYRVFGGAEFGYFGLELGYADLGRASFSAQSDGSGTFWAAGPVRESNELTAYDLSLIGRVPVSDSWRAFARLGAMLLDVDEHLSGTTQSAGFVDFRGVGDSTELAYGAGVEYRGLDRWRLIGAYQHSGFEQEGVAGLTDPQLDAFSLSVAYVWGTSQR